MTNNSTAINATPIANSQPGSNPNTRNAKPRKGNRPRTKNIPSQPTKDLTTRWIDPLPQVPPIQADLRQNFETLPSGEFDLDFDLPERIATPFAKAFASVSRRTIENDELIDRVKSKIISIGYYKAAKQLYASMTTPEQSCNQPLKTVYYDEAKVPSHMAAALSMIGHIDSKFGKIYINNAPTLFKRWIVAGLYNDPDCDISKTIPPEQLVWKDSDGYSLLRRLCFTEIDNMRKVTYDVTLGDLSIKYSIPYLNEEETDFSEYYQSILPNEPFTDKLKDLISLLLLSRDHWISTAPTVVPNARDLTQCLNHLNLCLAPLTHCSPKLRTAFEHCMSEYIVNDSTLVEGLFNMSPSPQGDFGYGAQLVSSQRLVARTILPQSDADMTYGFTFSPLKSFKFNPRVVAYSKFSSEQSSSAFAQQDLKSLAI